MADLFDNLADQHVKEKSAPATAPTQASGSTFDQLADEHLSTLGKDTTGPYANRGATEEERIHNTPYSDIVSNPNVSFWKKTGQVAAKILDESGHGVTNVLSGVPGALSSLAQGMMPTENIPVPGGKITEDTIRQSLKAVDLARKGKYTEAAKNTPVVGPMFDYATSHPIANTATAGIVSAALPGAGTKVLGKVAKTVGLGAVPTPPSVFGETPPVKAMLEVFKPANAVHALEDYNTVVPRLLREHPDLAQGNATLPQIQEALDQSMHENRNYVEAHIGPAKSARMQVDLNPVADAINQNISSVMERNAPEQADALRQIADRYRGKTDVADVENMMHELNAKVADMRKMNPGEWAQTTQASASKAFLDATTKAMRKAYNDSLEKFTGSPAVAQLNREYGAMMGFRQDLAGLIQDELVRNTQAKAGMGGKAVAVGKALLNPKRAIGNAALNALIPDTSGNIAKLSQAFKDYRGPAAPDYPTPPIYAGPGGTAGSPGNVAAGAYPGARPVPAGAFPGATPGPTAGYTATPAGPLPQRKLLGGATPSPVGQAEKIHPDVKVADTTDMVKIQGPEGQDVWVNRVDANNYMWDKRPDGRWELIHKPSLVSGQLSPASELPKRKR